MTEKVQVGSAQRQMSLSYLANLHQQALMGRHVSWLKDNRWTKCVTQGCPRDHRQPRGHQKRHWWDNLEEAIGSNWSHVFKDQGCWTISREGFLQQE